MSRVDKAQEKITALESKQKAIKSKINGLELRHRGQSYFSSKVQDKLESYELELAAVEKKLYAAHDELNRAWEAYGEAQ